MRLKGRLMANMRDEKPDFLSISFVYFNTPVSRKSVGSGTTDPQPDEGFRNPKKVH
jgi:hypothetical protein